MEGRAGSIGRPLRRRRRLVRFRWLPARAGGRPKHVGLHGKGWMKQPAAQPSGFRDCGLKGTLYDAFAIEEDNSVQFVVSLVSSCFSVLSSPVSLSLSLSVAEDRWKVAKRIGKESKFSKG